MNACLIHDRADLDSVLLISSGDGSIDFKTKSGLFIFLFVTNVLCALLLGLRLFLEIENFLFHLSIAEPFSLLKLGLDLKAKRGLASFLFFSSAL